MEFKENVEQLHFLHSSKSPSVVQFKKSNIPSLTGKNYPMECFEPNFIFICIQTSIKLGFQDNLKENVFLCYTKSTHKEAYKKIEDIDLLRPFQVLNYWIHQVSFRKVIILIATYRNSINEVAPHHDGGRSTHKSAWGY